MADAYRSRAGDLLSAPWSWLFQAHILVGRSKVEQRVQTYPWLLDSWSYPVQCCWLPDGAVHNTLMHEPLDLMQQRLALVAVTLLRLLVEEIINIRIAAIGVGARAEHKGLDAGGGVPQRRRGDDNDPLQLLLPPGRHEGRPLYGAYLRADANRPQIVGNHLTKGGEGWDRCHVASIKAVGIAGLSQKALGLDRVIGIRLQRQGEL